jgi:hypothetical protein
MTLKMPVLAPIPSASVTSAMAKNVGAVSRRKMRLSAPWSNTLQNARRVQNLALGAGLSARAADPRLALLG